MQKRQVGGGKLADITQADHPDHPLALVDDGQPADLQQLHVMALASDAARGAGLGIR